MRKIALSLAITTIVTAYAFPGAAAPSDVIGVLKPGAGIFWKGGIVGGVGDRAADMATGIAACGAPGPCFPYKIDVPQAGARLRVAIDVPQRNDAYQMALIAPDGTTTTKINVNAFNAEAFVADPAVGTWTVSVSPLTAEYSSFGLRAKLESTPYEPSAKKKQWLPNLQVPRLWEFGFVAPVSGIAGFSMDDANPPVDAAGIHPFSCTVDEMESGAHRCLRFSFQMTNAGDGVFDVRFNTSGNPLEGAMVQCIERPGKAPLARPAGEFDFHAVHAHYHYKDVVLHELFRVTDTEAGKLKKVGVGEKTGYNPADQSFAEWDRFVQAPSGTSGSAGNCYPGSTNRIGLSRGWGDAYRWQRPGNYVEFGTNPDGLYVIRTTADPLNHLKESDESDNTGYAYVRVVGDSVRLLEQGSGRSPWDPDKVVNRF